MIRELVTAIRTLTIIPVPGKDTSTFQKSILFFPVVGIIISLVLYVVYRSSLYCPDGLLFIKGLLFTLSLVIITGGIHIDGLADSADGFLGGRDKESVLRILKDSRIGTFGGVAIVFDIVTKIILIDFLINKHQFFPIAFAIINARIIQGGVLCALPNARGTEGTASPFSGANKLLPFLILLLFVLNALFYMIEQNNALFFAVTISSILIILLGFYFKKRIAGITGDCIGTANELFEISFLFVWCLTFK